MMRIVRKVMLGAAALLTLLSVYLLVGPDGRTTALNKRLDSEGVVADAKVVDKYAEEYVTYDNTTRSGRRSIGRVIRDHKKWVESATVNYDYFVEVEFRPASGPNVRAKKMVPGKYFDGIAIGSSLQILYHPEEPAEANRLTEFAVTGPDMDALYSILAMMILVVSAVLFWFGWPRESDGGPRGKSDRQDVAGNRMAAIRSQQAPAPAPVAAGRAAALRPAQPKGFGQPRRSSRA